MRLRSPTRDLPALPRAATVALLGTLALAAAPAAATTFPCAASSNCTEDSATGCTIFESKVDQVHDYYYYRLPDNYDPSKTYPLLLWFHAMGQASTSPSPNDDCIISSANILKEMANGQAGGLGARDMIVLGLAQRGPESFLGDFCNQSCPTPAADDQGAKGDLLELMNQLVSRFHINYVVVAGSSMGGYSSLRLAQLAPDKVHVIFASAPAVHRGVITTGDQDQNSIGSAAIDAALQGGAFDQKLLYVILGLADDNLDIIRSSHNIRTWMTGKPWFQYAEEQGVPHLNHFSDDYLCTNSGGYRSQQSKWPPLCNDSTGRKPFLQNVAYGCQHPEQASCGFSDPFTTDRLWDKVAAWETAHPAIAQGELQPSSGWQVPGATGWYLEQAFYNRGGKTPGAVVEDGGVVVVPDGSVGPAPNEDGGVPPGGDGGLPPGSDGGNGANGGGGGCGCRLAGTPAGGAGAGLLAGVLALGLALGRARGRARGLPRPRRSRPRSR
jgi:pimeloyl-ACP methyl ester carboxylesterase